MRIAEPFAEAIRRMRVLVVKIAPIGDVVLSLSMVTALRREHQCAEIVWLCGKSVAPLLSEIPSIELITVDEARLLTGSFFQRIGQVLSVWRRILARRFDLVVLGYSDRRYKILTFPAAARTRRAFNRKGGRWWPVPGRYHGDEFARLITGVDGPHASSAALPRINPRLSEQLAALTRGRTVIALAPGGARNLLEDVMLRRWPLDLYRRLAQELAHRRFSVAIVGAPSDTWVRVAFDGVDVLDLIGRTSLPELVAFYQRCAAVVTHDSGPMHLAVLAGAPTVALFGPTVPGEKVPKSGRIRVIWGGENLPCRPCYDGKVYAACSDNRCMKQISVAQVVKAVLDLVESTTKQETFGAVSSGK
jgi:heptosyltransferase II